jgi:hypothetical protein
MKASDVMKNNARLKNYFGLFSYTKTVLVLY